MKLCLGFVDVFVFVFVFACTPAPLDPCADARRPIAAEIGRGIGGFASNTADDCQVTCDCSLIPGEVHVHASDHALVDNDDARDLIRSTAPLVIAFDASGYEEPLDPGDYVACGSAAGWGESCARFGIQSSTIATVHVQCGLGCYLAILHEDGTKGFAPFSFVSGREGDACDTDDTCSSDTCTEGTCAPES